MNRKKFGRLIIALRREHLESQGKPWTREKFAQVAEIDEEIIANIENGRKAILQEEILLQIAEALTLTGGERKDFFLAASGVDEENIYRQQDTVKTALENMIVIMQQLQQPALLVDAFSDIIAINRMALEMYDIDVSHFNERAPQQVAKFNLMRFLFSPEFDSRKPMYGKSREKFAISAILQFRAASLRYRSTKAYKLLYEQLLEFEDFKNYIQRPHKRKSDDYADNNMFINLRHPKHGSIEAINTLITAISTVGELRLFMFAPLNEETAVTFANLAQQGNYIYQPLRHWPRKPELHDFSLLEEE